MKKIKRDWKILSKNLKIFLKEKRMSVSELALEVQVPKSNIANWMAGANPDIGQLDKVAQYFEITIEHLVFNRKEGVVVLSENLKELEGEYRVFISKIIKEKEGFQ
jgi:transcriptional regulator with XRE-family HTH domain